MEEWGSIISEQFQKLVKLMTRSIDTLLVDSGAQNILFFPGIGVNGVIGGDPHAFLTTSACKPICSQLKRGRS